MKKIIKTLCLCFFLLIFFVGCGEKNEGTVSVSQDKNIQGKDSLYDTGTGGWAEFQEVEESGEKWYVTDYWDDSDIKAPEAGMTVWKRFSAVDGSDYYIMEQYETEKGIYKYYLTCVDTETFQVERREVDFSEKARGTAELAEAVEQYRAVVWGMDVLEGRPCLLIKQRTEEEDFRFFRLQLDSDLKIEGMVELKLGKAAEKNDFSWMNISCDKEGYIYIGIYEIAVFDEKGDFIKFLEPGEGYGSMNGRAGRLPDGRPVFECVDFASERSVIFCLEDQKEKILYQGKYVFSMFRHISSNGEIIYVGNRGLLRWNTETGKCQKIYEDAALEMQSCEAVLADSDGGISLAFYEKGVSIVFRLKQGEREDEKEITIAQLYGSQEIEKCAAEYTRKHPGIRITVTEGEDPQNRDIALNQLMARIMEGEGPDIFILQRKHLEILQAQGILMDLSGLKEEEAFSQIFRGVLEYGTIENKLYGIVNSASPSTLAVSGDLWEEDTWTAEDVMGLLEAGKQENVPALFGNNMSAGQLLFELVVRDVMTGGSSLIDKQGKQCFFNSERFLKILEFCKKYGEDSDSSEYLSFDEKVKRVHEGKALALSLGPGISMFSKGMEAAGEGYRCVGYPTDSGYGSYVSCGPCVAVNAGTENDEISIDFIRYLLSSQVQGENGLFTVRKDILTDNIRNGGEDGERPMYVYKNKYVTFLGKRPDGSSFLPEYLDIMENGKPDCTQVSGMGSIITEEAEAFFHGGKSAEETAEVIQSRIWLYLNE